ncbi:hypothetical protein GLYMA_04G220551v4 [Glycine max]|nr:hypothetical protein GLYMA_04G220551v4 [Glycine max]
MGGIGGHLPLMVMIGLQLHYAALNIFTRANLLDGLNTINSLCTVQTRDSHFGFGTYVTLS